MSCRTHLAFAAALLLGGCSTAELVSPAGDEASLATVTSGRYGVAISYVLVGGSNVDWYGFEASDETGKLEGGFRMYQVRIAKGDGTYSWATVDVRGSVSCMKVESNKARLGGVVTSSDFVGLPVGTPMTWSVTDNGRPKWAGFRLTNSDAASAMFAGVDPTAYCNFGLAYPEQPVLLGDLTIAD